MGNALGSVVNAYAFRPPQAMSPVAEMTDVIWLPNAHGLTFPALYVRYNAPAYGSQREIAY